MSRLFGCIVVVMITVLCGLSSGEDLNDAQDELSFYELENLLDVEILTASNTAEKLSEAPATVIVLTQEDLQQRGYTEVSHILDDLPGMEVIRPYGDTQFKNYWRGYRNTIGEPFLVMVDGVILNHLYYNTGDTPLLTIPLSYVDRIEVVYGPASSVYGANAFMGVINIITQKDMAENGSHFSSRLTRGPHDTQIADLHYFYKKDDLRLSLAVHLDNGDLDKDAAQRYEFLQDKYYADRNIWGGFVDNPNIAGEFSSPRRHRGLDARLYMGDTEMGLQYFVTDGGYGLVFPADKVQNKAVWKRPDYSFFVRHQHRLNEHLFSTSMLRFRRSDVSNDSYFVDAYFDGENYVAAFSYWQILNASISFNQDFDVKVNKMFSFNTGMKYEQKYLQKAYDINGESAAGTPGGYEPVGEIDAATYQYPEPPPAVFQAQNRIFTEDIGVYVQSRYRLENLWGQDGVHQLHLGVRLDDNSKYGSATTIRSGYTAKLGKLGLKVLYGEAFQEPVPRLLYGGWTGSGSDPNLKPEESKTVEISASYYWRNSKNLISFWQVNNTKTIVNTPDGAKNLGDRTVTGMDYHFHYQLVNTEARQLKAWLYYSHIFKAEEAKFEDGIHVGEGAIGDLAMDKLWFGITSSIGSNVWGTVRGRFIGERETVDSNPIPAVDGFFTTDVHLEWLNVVGSGLGLSVDVYNLFDTEYDHPGIRDAGAGTTPGYFESDGTWVGGSQSYYNSLLPQPGRAVLVSLHMNY
ncbi:MAG: TonB-dependent receptor [Gemmatimonadetes bacterium]|nr:MAG: TonB-dependent receptor [Gemmatimonadota bacterium]